MEKKLYGWHFFSMSIYLILLILSAYYLYLLDKLIFDISILNLVLLGLAIFRLTRLIVYDLITDFIREPFKKFSSGLGKSIHQLLNCPWCVSMWVSLFIVFLYFLTPLTMYLIYVLSLAAIVYFLQIVSVFIVKKTSSQSQ